MSVQQNRYPVVFPHINQCCYWWLKVKAIFFIDGKVKYSINIRWKT